jgi:ABC-2 type transport system ATP-binding protein
VGATALLTSHVITDIQQACDRLLVLGGGRLLLDDSIAGALARHGIIEPVPAGPQGGSAPAPEADARWEAVQSPSIDLIGEFPGPDGERLGLVRGAVPGARPATLEEVVLGHLVAGRRQLHAAAGERAA